MIAVLLIASSFMIVILIGMAIIVIQFKAWAINRDKMMADRVEEMKSEISGLKSLFTNQISEVITSAKKMIK